MDKKIVEREYSNAQVYKLMSKTVRLLDGRGRSVWINELLSETIMTWFSWRRATPCLIFPRMWTYVCELFFLIVTGVCGHGKKSIGWNSQERRELGPRFMEQSHREPYRARTAATEHKGVSFWGHPRQSRRSEPSVSSVEFPASTTHTTQWSNKAIHKQKLAPFGRNEGK